MSSPPQDPTALRHEVTDLLVVGGGITGCAIARDAARRGLRVTLVERDDLGSATSSASSKLIHGGLRYLEQMRLGLVRESLREREILLRIAPHLVRPLPFLLPLYTGARRPRWAIRAGLTLYDLLSSRKSLPRHRMLSPAQALECEPRLRRQGLLGAALFYDCQMNDARLVLENALDAGDHGARILTRVEAVGLLEEAGRVAGVRAHDRRSDRRFEIRASLTVAATGPWYHALLEQQGLARPHRPRLSRGSHVVLPALTQGYALLLTSRSDGRVFFVLPWKGRTLVGTTEEEIDAVPRQVEPTDAEIDYLLGEVAAALEGPPPQRHEVLTAFAGVRALVGEDGADPGRLSREEEMHEEAPGLLGVFGGKYTTHRAIAERAVDTAAVLLDRRKLAPCTTHLQPLPGGDLPAMNDYFAVAEKLLVREYDLEPATLRHLLGTYGSRHGTVLELLKKDRRYLEPLEEGLPFLFGEVVHAVRNEMAWELDDVLWRRTWRAFAGPLPPAARRRWQEALDHARSTLPTGGQAPDR